MDNKLSSKDSLIVFGEINYINLKVTIDNLNIKRNVLELGTIYSVMMNSKQLMIKNSEIS